MLSRNTKVYRGYYTKISSSLKLSEKYSLVERSTYGDLVIFFIESISAAGSSYVHLFFAVLNCVRVYYWKTCLLRMIHRPIEYNDDCIVRQKYQSVIFACEHGSVV